MTEKQTEVFEFMVGFFNEKHYWPSTREIQSQFGWASQSAAVSHIRSIVRQGLLEHHGCRAYTVPGQTITLETQEKELFIVSRTSAGTSIADEDSESPCEGAVRTEVTFVDERTVDDPGKLPSGRGDDWYEYGTNHRVVNGRICRDITYKAWTIRMDFTDIQKFLETHGECVIRRDDRENQLHIEIYDDYRE